MSGRAGRCKGIRERGEGGRERAVGVAKMKIKKGL